MPTWSGVLREIAHKQQQLGVHVFDGVRREYLAQLASQTGRQTILYASQWTQPGAPPELVNISDDDMQGFMEVMHKLGTNGLDLIVHSPGGSIEATESIVRYVRSRFKNLRVIVPHAAMSAATMLACAANEIMMGKHSSLGPIDPQITVRTRHGVQFYPAQAILDQFERAKLECMGNPAAVAVWYPILELYGPSLIIQCEHANRLSKTLVAEWLEAYMFASERDAKDKAVRVADALSTHREHCSHGRHIARDRVTEMGLKVTNLEDDQKLQDLVLSVFHAATITFSNTAAVKIIENHLGKAYVKQQRPPVQVPRPLPSA